MSKPRFDPDRPIFGNAHLESVLPDFDPQPVHVWKSRGHFTPRQPAPGRGREQLYSFAEAAQIATMWQLTRRGVPMKIASGLGVIVADHARTKVNEALKAIGPEAENPEGLLGGELADQSTRCILIYSFDPDAGRLAWEIKLRKNFGFEMPGLDFHYCILECDSIIETVYWKLAESIRFFPLAPRRSEDE
jgi:hypothetical protein